MNVDQTLLSPLNDDRPRIRCQSKLTSGSNATKGNVGTASLSDSSMSGSSLTLGQAYERYISDPTQSWSARTRKAYDTTRRLAVSVIGGDVPISGVSRAQVRDFIEVLRFLPRNASKRFPGVTARAASESTRLAGGGDVISAANANVYLSDLASFLNWATREEILDRNPSRGLRLPDEMAKRDKRHPFSPAQLKAIFNSPLYTGCLDGDRGYAVPGSHLPRNARFWVPLLALHSGMRLSEICQLDVSDVRVIEGIVCIVITRDSLVGSKDKRLKTGASERVLPVHPKLVDLGLLAYAELQGRAGHSKLFHEINPGRNGVRAVAFSKWFTQFLGSCGAKQDRTCFHSFRHCYRDELRVARIDQDISMALGGWTTGIPTSSKASDNYGRGHRIDMLRDAVSRLVFADVDLSHLIR
jgi:integrase